MALALASLAQAPVRSISAAAWVNSAWRSGVVGVLLEGGGWLLHSDAAVAFVAVGLEKTAPSTVCASSSAGSCARNSTRTPPQAGDVACVGRVQPRHDAQKRALAAAVDADQTDTVAFVDEEVGALEKTAFAQLFGEVFDRDQVH